VKAAMVQRQKMDSKLWYTNLVRYIRDKFCQERYNHVGRGRGVELPMSDSYIKPVGQVDFLG
jgi:hypothetical protein